MQAQTITIIGLGRIGGSVGLALRQAGLGVTVVGHDPLDAKVNQQAKEMGAVDVVKSNLFAAVSSADIVVLAVPPSQLQETLRLIGGELKEHSVVVDLSSQKGLGRQWAGQYFKRGHYVGAGAVLATAALIDTRRGLGAADANLFRESVFCLMPSQTADPQAVETAASLGVILGARPFFIDADEYDSLMQGVETVPGLAAAALFQAARQSVAWRDVLRFAGAPFAIGTTLMQDEAEIAHLAFRDKEATLRWLDALMDAVHELRQQVAESNVETLAAFLGELGIERQRWLAQRARNDWQEPESGVETSGMMAQLGAQLFGFGNRRKPTK